MKILFLGCLRVNKFGNCYGGAEKSLINLSNWCAQSGFDVTLASVEGDTLAYPLNSKVKFVGYPVKENSSRIFKHLQMRSNTIDVIRTEKPDVVIGFWVHPLFYGVKLLKKYRIPYIYSLRNDPSREYSAFTKFMMSRVVKSASYIVFQTREAQVYFSDIVDKKSSVIHNPTYINEGQYKRPLCHDNRIVSVGRLNEQKNQTLLIEAFSELRKNNSSFASLKLEIYGEGPLREMLQNQINQLGLQNCIFLPGAFPDVLDRINGARLFVLPSLYEGMPNALIEAMCLGIPVLSADCPCGGPRELIRDGVNGYLFKNNNKEDLVRKMKHILENNNIQETIENELDIINTHSENTIFGKWERIIRNLCQSE